MSYQEASQTDRKEQRMKKAVLLCLLCLPLGCVADAIHGSIPFVGIGAHENGSNPQTSTMFTDTETVTSDVGTGNFAVVPVGTDFSNFTLALTSLKTGGTFALSNPLYGMFDATSGMVVHLHPNFIDVALSGVYTPGLGLGPGLDPTPAQLNLSFTSTGDALSGSMTMATTPTPELATITLFGSVLLPVGFVAVRKRVV